jgi:hypothetical protein
MRVGEDGAHEVMSLAARLSPEGMQTVGIHGAGMHVQSELGNATTKRNEKWPVES